MDPKRHANDIQGLSAALRRQQLVSAGLVLLTLLLSIVALGKETTTILEPPSRTKSIAVTGDRVDGAWLEEMGAWIAHMMLDASPHSITWQQEQILRWTHPSAHGQLQQEMAVQARRLKEANASTIFWLQQVAPDTRNQRVAVIGQLDTYVNGIRVQGASRNASYLVSFESKGGRMLLKEWREVPGDDIWLTRQLEAAQKALDESKK